MKSGVIINRLLSRNMSKTQLAGFVISNFIGLAIVIAGLQFYADVKAIWESEDSFIKRDYIVVNKKVTTSNTLGQNSTSFTRQEIDDISRQPWVRKIGEFENMDYNVTAYMTQGGRNLYTYMFFESIPSEFLDVSSGAWKYQPGSEDVPVIISKDYLTLYNFGFASSAGMPQITEQMLSAVPLDLKVTSADGTKTKNFKGRIVGFSNRLNTILVPEEFMKWSNGEYGLEEHKEKPQQPSRLIIDVSSPGDVAIASYLDSHNYELAGDKKNSQATYFLNLVSGLMVGVGSVITVLSFFILMLSVALLMQKNREKLHLLITLGIDLSKIGRPYERITAIVSITSFVLAIIAMVIFRNIYIDGIRGMSEGTDAGVWWSLGIGAALTVLTMLFNIMAIRRKVKGAFYK